MKRSQATRERTASAASVNRAARILPITRFLPEFFPEERRVSGERFTGRPDLKRRSKKRIKAMQYLVRIFYRFCDIYHSRDISQEKSRDHDRDSGGRRGPGHENLSGLADPHEC